MSYLEKFAKDNELELIKQEMFYILWKSTIEENRYYITNDLQFTKIFYAKNDKKALEIFYE